MVNSFHMFCAQVVSSMQEFYVSTVRFCALILEILEKYIQQNFLIKHITYEDAKIFVIV